jgi:hypothetical protein
VMRGVREPRFHCIFYLHFTRCFHKAINIKEQLRGRDRPSETFVFELAERMSVKFDTEGLKVIQFWFLILLHETQVAGTCGCGNEPSGSIKCGEFLD